MSGRRENPLAPIAGGTLSEADRLILEAATGARSLSEGELRLVQSHVAQAGFDPIIYRGRSAAEHHYQKHVARQQEWPLQTTFLDYLNSIRETVLDVRSGRISIGHRTVGHRSPVGARADGDSEPAKDGPAMATSSKVTQRIDGELDTVEEMVSELAEITEDWFSLLESVRVSWSLDWDQAMGTILRALADSESGGQMSPAQKSRYQALLRDLKRLMPVIAQLNLYRPPVPPTSDSVSLNAPPAFGYAGSVLMSL